METKLLTDRLQGQNLSVPVAFRQGIINIFYDDSKVAVMLFSNNVIHSSES